MTSDSNTRGEGLLESMLAKQRARLADRLIPEDLRQGRILDLGCGNYPLFLRRTRFREKIGLDQIAHGRTFDGITFVSHDIQSDGRFPYPDGDFSVITSLAVIEHLEPARVPHALREIHRLLAVGGVFILTTPAAWSDWLLRVMARTGLVSRVEIDEHKDRYNHAKLRTLLREAGFDSTELGYFELGLNLWARAVRRPDQQG